MTQNEEALAKAKARLAIHEKRGKVFKEQVAMLQERVWQERRPTCRHVANQVAEDIYYCINCNLDMST